MTFSSDAERNPPQSRWPRVCVFGIVCSTTVALACSPNPRAGVNGIRAFVADPVIAGLLLFAVGVPMALLRSRQVRSICTALLLLLPELLNHQGTNESNATIGPRRGRLDRDSSTDRQVR